MAEELSLDEINALVDSRIKACYDQIQVEVDRISQREPQKLQIGITEKPKVQPEPEIVPEEVSEIPKREFISNIEFPDSPVAAGSPLPSSKAKQWNPGQKKSSNNLISLDKFKKIVVKYGFRYYQNKLKPNIIDIQDAKHPARRTMMGELEPLYAGRLNTNNGIAKVGTRYAFGNNGFFSAVLAPSEFVSTDCINEFERLVSNLATERDEAYENRSNNSSRNRQDW